MRITQLGESVLRRKARLVNRLKNPSLRKLVRDMIQTMYRAKGVGIAAPQVGKSLRLFIVAPRPSVRYPRSPRMKPRVMINPQLLRHSKTMHTDWEGCLSIPGLRGRVPRYTRIQISYISPDEKKVTQTLRGFVARIFQHEFDHINGHVYLDRVKDPRTFVTENQYRQAFRRKSARLNK